MRQGTAITIAAASFLAGVACIAVPLSRAADLGGPKTVTVTKEDTLPALRGCFAETALTGTFLRVGDRQATGTIGGGCDAKLGVAIIGGGVRAGFGDVTSGQAYARVGLAVNPLLVTYGLVSWTVPDWKVKTVGQLGVGLGVETAVLFNGLSAFAEGTTAVGKFGPGVSTDDITITVGGRYRF